MSTQDTNKIAVCTDFTSIAQHAFEESIALAKKLNAVIHLVHVLIEDSETEVTADKKMAKMVDQAKGQLGDVEVKFNVVDGGSDIVDELNKEVTKLAPAYFVVGYEVKKGLDRFFGPNIMKIVRGTKLPVLAIKEDETLKDLDDIVFPLNLWDYARQKTFATIRLAQRLGATIHLIGLDVDMTDGDRRDLNIFMNQLKKQFDEYGVKYTDAILQGDDEVSVVVDFANKVDADLIAKVFHHDPGLISRLRGNQDEETLVKSNMPLFVVKSTDYMQGDWSVMRG